MLHQPLCWQVASEATEIPPIDIFSFVLKDGFVDISGDNYEYIEISLTEKNVKGLDYKGSYLNYYLENEVLLLPFYSDANDDSAVQKMQSLYPDHTVVLINVTNLYKNGEMLHCMTQQPCH